MSHGLEEANGRIEALYTGSIESIWHRLGTAKGDQPITTKEAGDLIDFPVEFRKLSYDLDGETRASSHRSILRLDTGKELAVVGPDYKLIPFSKALVEAIKPFVEEGLATIDTTFVLDGGKRAVVLLKWNTEKLSPVIRDVYGDELKTYGACVASHGGSANLYYNTVIRAVCANTVALGQYRENRSAFYTVAHRGKNTGTRTIDAVDRAFRGIVLSNEKLAEQIKALRAYTLSWDQFESNVLDVAQPKAAPDARKDVAERAEKRRVRVANLWFTGRGHEGNGSAWEAVNGLIQSLDHDEFWRGATPERRFAAVTQGNLKEIRENVWSRLVGLATA
jgi:hypothetical protein